MAQGGRKLTWKCNKSASELTLVDAADGKAVARMKYRHVRYLKEGWIEIFEHEVAKEKEALDEVVVTGQAIGYLILYWTLASWGAAAAFV